MLGNMELMSASNKYYFIQTLQLFLITVKYFMYKSLNNIISIHTFINSVFTFLVKYKIILSETLLITSEWKENVFSYQPNNKWVYQFCCTFQAFVSQLSLAETSGIQPVQHWVVSGWTGVPQNMPPIIKHQQGSRNISKCESGCNISFFFQNNYRR